jgi:hypothetical protein
MPGNGRARSLGGRASLTCSLAAGLRHGISKIDGGQCGRGRGRRVYSAAGLLWPAGNAGQGVAGDPGSSRLLPIPPAPPNVSPRHRNDQHPEMRRGAGGIGTRQRAGRWGSDSAQSALPVPDPTPGKILNKAPSRAPAARRARGAERERALAGCSGGASGPCRPGLKSYRKFSPDRNAWFV